MTNETKGIVYILIFQTLVGLSPILIKIINPNLAGALLVFIRYAIASIFFLGLILLSAKLRQEIKTLPFKKIRGLIFLGLLSSGLGSLLFVIAIRMIGASITSLVESLEIPIGILLAIVLLHERLTKRFIVIGIGILIGFYMLTVKGSATVTGTGNFLGGIAIALLCALIFGYSTVLGKILLKDNISPTVVSFFRQGFGAVFNLAVALFTVNTLAPVFALGIKDWTSLLMLGTVVGGFGFILYYDALHKVPVKKISFFFIASPIVSTITGVAVGERLGAVQWIGATVILIGIGMLLRTKESEDALPEKEEE